MNQSDKGGLSERLKIGARVLRENQAAILMPGYPKMHEQIADFRKQAARRHTEEGLTPDHLWLKKYNRDFNANVENVISVLGERGSGKTSVMLTFKYFHSKQFHQTDLVLPLISPDQMSGASDTLGWVLGFLHNEMEEVDQKFRSRQEQQGLWREDAFCSGKEVKTDLRKAYDALQKAYLLRQETYAAMIRKRDEGLYEQMRDQEKIVNADQRLIDLFHDFVNRLIEAKKTVIADKALEPLILIFFDDVDISAGRCMEVLDAVRTYLSHPNVIVFVSGAYSVFIEAVTIHMLHEEKVGIEGGYIDFVSDWNGELSALARRKERSREYLKKVFPPAYRYEMKKALTDREKAEFTYYLNEKEGEYPPTFMELLAGIRVAGHDRPLASLFGASGRSQGNAASIKHAEAQPVPHVYFRIFDANARGLVNPYYFLYVRKDRRWNGIDMLQFLQVVIHSNKELADAQLRVHEVIRMFFSENGSELDKARTYIDYAQFQKYLLPDEQASKDRLTEEAKGRLELEVTILLLADFFEKLLGLLSPGFRVGDAIKTKPLAALLNRLYGANLFPVTDSLQTLLRLYDKLPSVFGHLVQGRALFDPNAQTHYLERQYLESLSDAKRSSKAPAKNSSASGKAHHEEKPGEAEYRLLRTMYSEDKGWVEDTLYYIYGVGKSDEEIMQRLIGEAMENGLFFNDYIRLDVEEEFEVWPASALSEYFNEILKIMRDQLDQADKPTIGTNELYVVLQFIHRSEEHAAKEKELAVKRQQSEEIRIDIAKLQQPRWLRGTLKPEETLKKIKARIKFLQNSDVLRGGEEEASSLIREYFTMEPVSIDGSDVERAYSDNSNIMENISPFVDGIDMNLHLAIFNPLTMLRKYITLQNAKQFVKSHEVLFKVLLYDNPAEMGYLTVEQRVLVSKYFELSSELELLQRLLPAGETTEKETLQALVNNAAFLHQEMSDLVFESKLAKDRTAAQADEIGRKDDDLRKAMLGWQETKSHENRRKLIEQISFAYAGEQNFKFNRYATDLIQVKYKQVLNKVLHSKPLNETDRIQYSEFCKALSELADEFIRGIHHFIQSLRGDVKDLWSGILEKCETDDEITFIPSTKLYLLTRFAVEMNRIEVDTQANGSIAYFRALKDYLRSQAEDGFTAFDIYLNNQLNSKPV